MTAVNTAGWAGVLLVFWVILSGRLDALHLGMGLLSVGGALVVSRPLLALAPSIGPGVSAPLPVVTIGRFLLYLPWLFGQIVLSSIHVALVVLHPRMPIAPRVFRVRAPLPHPLARLTLAQSITLTPGTVTIDLSGDEFLVHALTSASARGLEASSGFAEMPRHVRDVFADPPGTAP
jgi:multicomponent Na+:H+ antiporter subunit E